MIVRLGDWIISFIMHCQGHLKDQMKCVGVVLVVQLGTQSQENVKIK